MITLPVRFTGLLLSLTWLGLSVGLIGCGGEDDPEVYPALVEPMFSATIFIEPDNSMLVRGRTSLQFRGGGNDLFLPEKSKTDSHFGCYGGEDPDPIYELGDYENINNASVYLNGSPLTIQGMGKFNP